MSTLRNTPIPDHSFPDQGEVRVCPDCQTEWDTRVYDAPPPWPCRRQPIERSGPPERKTPLRPVSPDRKRKRADRGVYGEYHEWISGLPCALAFHPEHRCRGDVVGHHVRHASHAPDEGNEVPCCAKLHQAIHDYGVETVGEEYGVDFYELAEGYLERWEEREVA